MTARTVLVVDDEPLIRMTIADSLQNAGFDVCEAADADSALNILRTVPGIALLCTDVNMPGDFNGIQLALLGTALNPGLRVIIISGGLDPEQVSLSGIPFLSKPFSPDCLLDLVSAELTCAELELLQAEP